MDPSFQTIFYLIMAGGILFLGVFVLRVILRLAWKLVRMALVIASFFLIAGYFLGFLDIIFR